jgi:hypothetical protein
MNADAREFSCAQRMEGALLWECDRRASLMHVKRGNSRCKSPGDHPSAVYTTTVTFSAALVRAV